MLIPTCDTLKLHRAPQQADPNSHSAQMIQRTALPNMALNFDILLGVMSFLCPKELVAMMQTCRTLYYAGAVQLPRFPVNISYLGTNQTLLDVSRKVLSFCQFMLAEPSRRFRYLKGLTLSGPGLECPQTAELLGTVLRGLTSLEVLALLDGEFVVGSHPQIRNALCSLTNLKELFVSDPGPHVCEMFKEMKSPLVKLCLPFSCYDDSEDTAARISPFSATLEELSLSVADFLDITEVERFYQFPRVRILTIHTCTEVEIRPLIDCFPNLTDLTFFSNYATDEEWKSIRHDEIETIREDNRTDQEAGSWKHLDRLRGDIGSVYLLAPACHVHSLELTSLTSVTAMMLDDVVRDTSPACLSIEIIAHKFFFGSLCALLQHTPVFTRLQLNVDFSCHTARREWGVHPLQTATTPVELDYALTNILEFLKKFPITHLMLRFHWAEMPSETSIAIPESLPRANDLRIEKFLRHAKHEQLAAWLLEAVPSLRAIYLNVHPNIVAESTWAVDEREDGMLTLRSLSSEAGRDFMHAEAKRA